LFLLRWTLRNNDFWCYSDVGGVGGVVVLGPAVIGDVYLDPDLSELVADDGPTKYFHRLSSTSCVLIQDLGVMCRITSCL
jgi:hypothetical protein